MSWFLKSRENPFGISKVKIPVPGAMINASPLEAEYLNLDNSDYLKKEIEKLKKENEKLKSEINSRMQVVDFGDVMISVSLETFLKFFGKGTIQVINTEGIGTIHSYWIRILSLGNQIDVKIPYKEYSKLVGSKEAINKTLSFDTINGKLMLFRNEFPDFS